MFRDNKPGRGLLSIMRQWQ